MKNNKRMNIQTNKIFKETRITTRNFYTDWIQAIRNILGLRLLSYEEAIQKQTDELETKYLTNKKVKWFRFDIEQIDNGAFLIHIYGEYK